MLKTTITLIAFCLTGLLMQAQDLVKTDPENKIAVVEELTGTNCPACPSGHAAVKSLLASNPNAIALAYSPSNSGLTGPYRGSKDLRRSFLNAFYTNPYYGNGEGRSMPSGFVNRRRNSATQSRRLSTSAFAPSAATINQELSPVNMGLESLFDSAFNELVITTEMYFTQDVTSNVGLYVFITEDSINALQSGSNDDPYYHFHVFRENVTTDQWGDPVTDPKMTGQLVKKTYGFQLANAIDPLNIEHCHVVAFLYDQTAEEIITGIEVDAKNGTTREATTAIDDIRNEISLSMSPNPVQDVATVRFTATGTAPVSLQVFDVLGIKVLDRSIQAQPGTNVTRISSSELGLTPGSYFVRVEDGEKAGVVKMLVK